MRTVGALALAIGFVIMGGSALANDQVCPDLDTGKINANQKSVTVTAPDGFLIDQYCAKSGSEEQDLGPEMVTVNPPQKSVTITHSSGKDVSHYSVSYVAVQTEPAPAPTTPATTAPTTPPTAPPAVLPAEESKEEKKDEVKGVVITASDAEEAQALPATLAFTGPRDHAPLLGILAGLFITAGLWLQSLGSRRAKQSISWTW